MTEANCGKKEGEGRHEYRSEHCLQMSSLSPPYTDCHGALPTTAGSRTQRSPGRIFQGRSCHTACIGAFSYENRHQNKTIQSRRVYTNCNTSLLANFQKGRNKVERDACAKAQAGHHAGRAGTSILHHCFVARSSQSPTLAVAPVQEWHSSTTNTWIEHSLAFPSRKAKWFLRAMIFWPLQHNL